MKFKTEVNKIFLVTINRMKQLQIYKPEFDESIRTYAEMQVQYRHLMSEYIENGCEITEEYTNKSGFTNVRKTAKYMAIESLRKDLIQWESILGLTPIGLQRLKDSGKKTRKSKMSEFVGDG